MTFVVQNGFSGHAPNAPTEQAMRPPTVSPGRHTPRCGATLTAPDDISALGLVDDPAIRRTVEAP
jgi:hypothetical protein